MDTLVYVDPSHRGLWVLALAAQLPRQYTGRLVLLATEEDAARDGGLLGRAQERLAATGAPIEAKHAPGPAERAILEEAARHDYTLVVVPPAGRNALQRLLKGSRVATVVRAVRASVLVARRPPGRVERVLCAVSGGALTEAVIRAGLDLERALGATVTFFHVAPEVALPFERAGAAPATPEEDPAAASRRLLAAHGRELVEREGLVVDEVVAEVENGAHDMLVIGASPEREGAGWGREDTTERLLLACPVSTLIVRAG